MLTIPSQETMCPMKVWFLKVILQKLFLFLIASGLNMGTIGSPIHSLNLTLPSVSFLWAHSAQI